MWQYRKLTCGCSDLHEIQFNITYIFIVRIRATTYNRKILKQKVHQKFHFGDVANYHAGVSRQKVFVAVALKTFRAKLQLLQDDFTYKSRNY